MAIYIYDNTALDIYSTEDYGTISSAVTVTDDFGVGALSSAPTLAQDWFSINNSTTQVPFGSINISGTKSEASVKSNLVRGTFVTFGTAGKVRGSNWVGFGTVFEIGNGLERTLRPYVSSGTLRLGVYTIPKGTLFNSQTVTFAPVEEFSQSTYTFDSNLSSFDSQSSIDATFDPYDFGYSSALVSKISNPPENKQLFSISGAAPNIKKIANPPENTQLFRISGAYNNLKSTDSWVGVGTIRLSGSASKIKGILSYVGLGTLFEVGIKTEKRTYVYDKTTVVSFVVDDLGLISQTTTLFDDFGTGTLNDPANQSEDYGIMVASTGPVSGALYPFGTSYFSGQGSESYVRTTYISSGQPAIKISGKDTIFPNIKIIPHYGIEKNIGVGTTGVKLSRGYTNLKSTDSWVGVGTIRLSGGNRYAKVVKQPQSTQLFAISGSCIEKFTSNPPENKQLFVISGAYSNLKKTKSNVGFGTFKISGTKIEKFTTQGGENSQLFTISGSKIEKYSRAGYRGIPGAITLYNSNTVFPDIRIIPHYGIEKNIGVGTTGVKLSGSSVNYSNRYPGTGGGLPVGSGIGTIRINDFKELTFYRANIPYYAKDGLIKILGTKNESYTRKGYIGLGTARISSVSSNKKISLYRNVGFGTISVIEPSTPSVLKKVGSYVGLTTILLGKYLIPTFDSIDYTFDSTDDKFDSNYAIANSTATKKQVHAYRGSGTINEISGSANSISRISRTNTILYKFSGNGSVSKVSNPPENKQLFVISGAYNNLKKTKAYSGIGTVSIQGSAKIVVESTAITTGLFKFITHTADNVYDTVDSPVSVDYVDAARVKFIANPPENTQLFTISGSAITSKRVSRSYVGIAGSIAISGSATNIKRRRSYAGIGTIFEISSGLYKDTNSYKGSGSIALLSGSAKSVTKKPVTTSVLYNLSGISSTRINHIVRISGIGTIAIGKLSAITKKTFKPFIRVSPTFCNFSNTTPTFDQTGSTFDCNNLGILRLYGEVVYPNVKFVPAPKTTGSITILGFASKRHSKTYETSGSLFGFSGAFQSYTRKPYLGIGTIHISAISGITTNNPYQIPRSYVIII